MTRTMPACLLALVLPLGAVSPTLAATLQPSSIDTTELTAPAVPIDNAVHATVRTASATGFRPAPVPDETLVGPQAAKTDDDAGSLHPELLGERTVGTDGALASASSDYDHDARLKPAGGMGVTIPMQ